MAGKAGEALYTPRVCAFPQQPVSSHGGVLGECGLPAPNVPCALGPNPFSPTAWRVRGPCGRGSSGLEASFSPCSWEPAPSQSTPHTRFSPFSSQQRGLRPTETWTPGKEVPVLPKPQDEPRDFYRRPASSPSPCHAQTGVAQATLTILPVAPSPSVSLELHCVRIARWRP